MYIKKHNIVKYGRGVTSTSHNVNGVLVCYFASRGLKVRYASYEYYYTSNTSTELETYNRNKNNNNGLNVYCNN